jgi:transposase
MTEKKDLRSRLVIGQKRDGRREYDDEARDELIRLCLRPGVSIARTAMEHDINPNLLRTWVTQYRQKQAAKERAALISPVPDGAVIDVPVPTAVAPLPETNAAPFVPVVHVPTGSSSSPKTMTLALHVRLPNGVELELGEAIATVDELTTMVQILGRLPCSGSTKS